MPAAHLAENRLIRIGGSDAQSFLQALVTTDIEALGPSEARPGALLTPQGKLLFDFIVWRDGDAFLLETHADSIEALTKRLMLYRLRAAVEITVPETDGTSVFWGEDAGATGPADHAFALAGIRLERRAGRHAQGGTEAYHALRIAAGIALSGHDYALQDAFPHDILLDRNGGLSFRKGCYVGQEVVSRMQHRGTARRRLAQIAGEDALPASGTEIIADGRPAGTLGSVCGSDGLAILRIDRIGEALAKGADISADGIKVSVALPGWSGLTLDAGNEGGPA